MHSQHYIYICLQRKWKELRELDKKILSTVYLLFHVLTSIEFLRKLSLNGGLSVVSFHRWCATAPFILSVKVNNLDQSVILFLIIFDGLNELFTISHCTVRKIYGYIHISIFTKSYLLYYYMFSYLHWS